MEWAMPKVHQPVVSKHHLVCPCRREAASVPQLRRERPSVSQYAWVPGLCGGPDVPAKQEDTPPPPSPHSHSTNTDEYPWDLALWEADGSPSSSNSSTPSTLASPLSSDTAAAQYREEVIAKIVELKGVKPVKINFNIYLTETTHNVWETVLHDNTLYMTVPPVLSNGSKESFITLLEFAEERLGCARCVLCVRKSRSDRAALLRAFMFMGFQLLSPGGAEDKGLLQTARPDYLYMVYVME